MTAKSLEARVEELENVNRKQRPFGIFYVDLILVMCACWYAMDAWSWLSGEPPEPVTAKAFYLQDSHGEMRGGLKMRGGIPVLWFDDGDGREMTLGTDRLDFSSGSSDDNLHSSLRLGTSVFKNSLGLHLETVNTDPRLGAMTLLSSRTSSLRLEIENNKGPSLNLESGKDSGKDTPSISLRSPGGGAVLDVDRKRGPALNLSTRSGANAAKKVIWSAP